MPEFDISEEVAAASEGQPVTHRQRLTNQAAAFLGLLHKEVPDSNDIRTIIRIMYAAVQ